MKISLAQFKDYLHFFEDLSVEEEIISSFSADDHICDMSGKEAINEFKVDTNTIEYFTFVPSILKFENPLPDDTIELIFVKLGESGNSVFGIAYVISKDLEERILNCEKNLEQEHFNLLISKEQLNKMSKFY